MDCKVSKNPSTADMASSTTILNSMVQNEQEQLIKAIKKSAEEILINKPSTTTTTTTSNTPMAPTTNENDTVIEHLKPEVEYGNVEYKLQLINPSADRLEHLVSQMKWRMGEGGGECVYELGFSDDGTAVGLSDIDMEASLTTLKLMASKLSADLTVVRERQGINGKVLEVLVRKFASEDFSEIRIACVGNVDAGKSTLLSVLSRGQLDDGRGKARAFVFRHRHEIESGRTSSVSQEILGFDSKGKIVNYNTQIHSTLSPSEICEQSSKIVTFIDLAGHEKYLRTTLYGLTSTSPDFTMMAVGGNMGPNGMAKEHLGIALSLRIPVFIVVTKIDRAPENVLSSTMEDLKKILKGPGARKLPVVIRNQDDVVVAARNFVSERIVPIFTVSNVTGENLDLLRSFLNLLPAKKEWEILSQKPCQLDIDSIWNVSGVGTVVSGTVIKGTIETGDTLLIGPNEIGEFIQTQIKSIHTKRLPVKRVKAGQTASLALKKIKKEQIRKGMVVVHPSTKPVPTREFEAELLVLFHSTTINKNYEAVIHCGCVQQSARLVEIYDKDVLRTGDRAKVKFRYQIRPEFLTVGSKFVVREGHSKGIGRVTSITPYVHEPINITTHKASSGGPTHGQGPNHPTNTQVRKQTRSRANRLAVQTKK
ncbi:hypothetical protein DICPUDRAFT_147862 [Dictyostelium purpureum]|uniref:Tr-type G domain-containing protein n=1 Tax=Dictyostelium purpureum TaxID=5786 RepID=F0Z9L7_DICPU|nr:uncharacterized protein DICPUDRAFT_147862 [Dictyostelium purpureum]EGC39348.1 hypothetical protein DICPUDRAFT_147862 [Dictyostelium purpureum]|eukprot:XP_003284136.1 hypothetical protein DICPUDRAFT_147862 [Dictyostelium purpureum]